MLIGELSKRSGFSRHTIRYYEKLLLINNSKRCSGNSYKDYTGEVVERLLQIRQLKTMGFTLREVRQLLVEENDPCRNIPGRLTHKLGKIDKQIATLLKFKSSLIQMKNACGGDCAFVDGMPSCVPKVDARQQLLKCS